MKTLILAVAVGALLAGCSYKSETTVQRPVAQPAPVVMSDSTTTTTTRDNNTGATTSTTVYR